MARTKSKLQAAALGGTPDDVEAAFYEALRSGDLERLMACWADEDEIVCIHPGGQCQIGMASIRASFEAIFANGSTIPVSPAQIRRVDAVASAVHHVLERVDVMTPQGPAQAYVLATNVYHKAAQGWRLVVHHASPGKSGEIAENPAANPVLH